MKTILAAIAIAVSMAGCAVDDRTQRIGSGAVIGGVAGNVLGGGAAGTVGGAVLGGLIGYEVDRSRNEERYRNDQRYREAQRAYDECRRRYSRRECDDRRY